MRMFWISTAAADLCTECTFLHPSPVMNKRIHYYRHASLVLFQLTKVMEVKITVMAGVDDLYLASTLSQEC